ncbi:hypothetical protein [Streptomyces sp. NPDC046685]|uniref:hypothetical protein n=1 Tax=Streptomyces sp. NPDC046685 TaxID=3157202 RepID=UPI0033E3C32C
MEACTSCGESEELRGEPWEGDIKVTCLTCGAHWMRGAPRCAGCGGTDIVTRPQAKTRHSRGNQLSIIGWDAVPLCRVCDAEALDTSMAQNTAVPGDYVSVFLSGKDGHPPAPPAAKPPGLVSAPPSGLVAAPQPSVGRVARPDSRRTATTPHRPRSPRPQPVPTAVPTVRQAIAAFLADASGEVDHTALVLLGVHLGSHNRLGILDETGAADRLGAWCDSHWSERGSASAERALSTIRRAVDFWGARGWLAADPAVNIR